MAKSLVFAKNKISNGLKGYLISRALVQGSSILGDGGTPLPLKLKLVLVKKSVSVKIGIGKNRYRYRYVISIGGKNRYRYVIYFRESVSVRLKVPKSVRIGIG